MTPIFTKEQEEWLHDNYIGKSSQDITDEMNELFGTNFTRKQIQGYKSYHGLVSGMQGKTAGSKKHQFTAEYNGEHKGLPLLSEFTNAYGYIYIKVGFPSKWISKARYVYEKEVGPLPKGCRLVFLDGDKTNCDISNIMCVKREVQTRTAVTCRFSKDPDRTKVGLAISSLEIKLNEFSKKKGGNNK